MPSTRTEEPGVLACPAEEPPRAGAAPFRTWREDARPVRPRVVVAESSGFSARALELLARETDVRLLDANREELGSAIGDAEVLWVRLRHRIDADLLRRAPRLKVVVTPTTGLGHVDLEEAARRDVSVLSLRGRTEFLRNVRATAEHTIGLMLALLRHLPAAAAHASAGGWTRDLFRGRELYGSAVGLVGFGRLGRIVARYLLSFGARVLATDPHVRSSAALEGVFLVPLGELLAGADVVSLHASLTEESRGFFGREAFEAMRPGAVFVNTARGELVDEAALLAALASGRLAGAALDVLSGEEPGGMAGHPLVEYASSHPNVIVTPHIGGCTFESIEKTEVFMAETLLAHLRSLDSAESTTPPRRAR